jgi:hypothetical protein
MIDYKKQGKANKLKGKRFEQKIAKTIREAFEDCGLDETFLVRRGFQSRSGREAADVNVIDKYHNEVAVHCECKHGKQPNIAAAFQQAYDEKFPFAAPVAITRKNNGPILATVDLNTFIDMLCAWAKEQPKTEKL